MGIPGLVDGVRVGEVYESMMDAAKRHVDVAAGRSGMIDLAAPSPPRKSQ